MPGITPGEEYPVLSSPPSYQPVETSENGIGYMNTFPKPQLLSEHSAAE